jgi:hypothetical protein
MLKRLLSAGLDVDEIELLRKQLNGITLGQRQTNYINQMITIRKLNKLIPKVLKSNLGLVNLDKFDLTY